MIFQKWGGAGGSKAVWNFSENSSVLVPSTVPQVNGSCWWKRPWCIVWRCWWNHSAPLSLFIFIHQNLCIKNKFYWHLKCLQLSECIYVGWGIKFEIVPKYSKHASHIIELFWRKSIIHNIVIIYFPSPRKITLKSKLSSSVLYLQLSKWIYVSCRIKFEIVPKYFILYSFYYILYLVLKYFM